MIRVVSARAAQQLDASLPVIVRTARFQVAASVNVIATFDEILDNPGTDSLRTIVDELERHGRERDIVYAVPGCAVPGDATVAAIEAPLLSGIEPGTTDRGTFGRGSCTVVDALELALAELHAPFDRGMASVNPALPLVVTNWYGDTVVQLASQRLERVYGGVPLPSPTDDFELLVPAVEPVSPSTSASSLEHIVARLRRPDGCPWDRDQTRESLFPQFEGELQELGDAIRSGDVANQAEELGDLLFHILAQCQVATEAGDFTYDDVVRSITGKLVRRHPHVFGDVVAETYDDVLQTWQRVKAEEKAASDAVQ